jgi:site-specific recombinase XerD
VFRKGKIVINELSEPHKPGNTEAMEYNPNLHPNSISGSLDVQAFRTLLLFLYGTGALISESRKVLLKDVDLKNKTMTIRGGRFDRVRTIPIGFDLHRILARYIAFRKSVGNRGSPELFINKRGWPLQIRTVYITFRRIRRFAGLEPSGMPNPPRMHDLRNAFVVHRLSAWYKTGADLRRRSPHSPPISARLV